MADNRLAIVCAKCRQGRSLAKLYVTDSVWYSNLPFNAPEFFGRHVRCHADDPWDRPEDQFFLGFESDGKEWVYESA